MHTVDIVYQLPYTLVTVVTTEPGIIDGIFPGTAEKGFHVVDDNQQPFETAQMNDFRKGAKQVPGIVFGNGCG